MSFSSDGTSAYGRRGNELLDVLNGSSYSITFTCNCKDFDVLLGKQSLNPLFQKKKVIGIFLNEMCGLGKNLIFKEENGII